MNDDFISAAAAIRRQYALPALAGGLGALGTDSPDEYWPAAYPQNGLRGEGPDGYNFGAGPGEFSAPAPSQLGAVLLGGAVVFAAFKLGLFK